MREYGIFVLVCFLNYWVCIFPSSIIKLYFLYVWRILSMDFVQCLLRLMTLLVIHMSSLYIIVSSPSSFFSFFSLSSFIQLPSSLPPLFFPPASLSPQWMFSSWFCLLFNFCSFFFDIQEFSILKTSMHKYFSGCPQMQEIVLGKTYSSP